MSDETGTPGARRNQKAVINGVLQHWSPSQVNTFNLCNTLWGLEKIDGLRRESTGSQNTGTAWHGEMEEYYINGTMPKTPSLLRAIESGTLPPRRPDIEIEASVSEPPLMAAGVPCVGYIDLRVPPDANGHVLIIDWKTCKTYKYTKTPEQLALETQGVSYMRHSLDKYKEATTFSFAHCYLSTTAKTGSFRYVESAPQSREDVLRAFAPVEETVERMKVAAVASTGMELQRNWDSCDAYGGCPQFAKCHGPASIYDSFEPTFTPAADEETAADE